VPPQLRGTYAGLATAPVIEYLRRLGVTTIELMPVHTFVDDRRLVQEGMRNYWGYNTIGYFAPHAEDSAPEQYLPQAWSAPLYEGVKVPPSLLADPKHLRALPRFLAADANEGRIRFRWRFDTPERYQEYMVRYYRLITEVDAAVGRVVDELKALRTTYGIKILGYVIMPDHVHLVLLPPDGIELGRVIGQLKSKSARSYFAMKTDLPKDETKILWLRRCYDHNCRDTQSIIEKINYCHNNPSKKGLVSEPGEWKWSSFGWYEGKRDGPLKIDAVEI
jgi:REP element-mobilizing transposase RayT